LGMRLISNLSADRFSFFARVISFSTRGLISLARASVVCIRLGGLYSTLHNKVVHQNGEKAITLTLHPTKFSPFLLMLHFVLFLLGGWFFVRCCLFYHCFFSRCLSRCGLTALRDLFSRSFRFTCLDLFDFYFANLSEMVK